MLSFGDRMEDSDSMALVWGISEVEAQGWLLWREGF